MGACRTVIPEPQHALHTTLQPAPSEEQAFWEQLLSSEQAFWEQLLSSEQACSEYLFQLKWPEGFRCPYCGHGHAYTIHTRRLPLYECSHCKHQTSLTAGTLMERSRTPLTKWFTAIYYISNPHTGINAVALQHLLHVTYKTAWSMLHAIRQAMSHDESMLPLSGQVQVHGATLALWETAIGFFVPPATPSVLVGLSLTQEGKPARVRMQALCSTDYDGGQPSAEAFTDFCGLHLAPKDQISSVECKRYGPRKLKKGLPLVRQTTEWLNSTFHGIGSKYRQRYLNEFCCRMNLVLAGLNPFHEISLMCARPICYSCLGNHSAKTA
jgi:transposase-like protein